MKNAVIALLVVALAVSIVAGVIARMSRTVNVEVRVWQGVNEPGDLWLSARPDGGSWADAGTVPVSLDDGLSSGGRYRFGDLMIALSVPPPAMCADASLAADCAALLAARDALAGGDALNWSTSVPVAEWEGVTVSGSPRRVTGLDLRARGLTGDIPPELADLTALGALSLSGNAFTGCIPERLRLIATNDLLTLRMERELSHCMVREIPSGALSAGTYQFDGANGAIIDIPMSGPQVALTHLSYQDDGWVRFCLTTLSGENKLCLFEDNGQESSRVIETDGAAGEAIAALFDEIVTSARSAPVALCTDASLVADCAALLAAKQALTNGDALNWSASVPVTDWDGVWLWGTPRRVRVLNLQFYGLTGELSPDLANLPLARVYLKGNAFTGCIPEGLQRAHNDLEWLRMELGLAYCPVR